MEAEHISRFLGNQTNQGLVKPELTRQASGDERKLAVAIQSKLIKDCSLEEIKESLRLVMVKIGLRANNWPNDLEKIVLCDHIRDNFGGNRVDEIRLAFEMAIGGKLEFGKDESVVAFENFSCLYFSSVMNAYQKWSSQSYNFVKPIGMPEQKIFTQEELDNSAREDAERQYQLYLKRIDLKGLGITKEILMKDGLMKEGESVIDFFNRKANRESLHIYVQGE